MFDMVIYLESDKEWTPHPTHIPSKSAVGTFPIKN